MPRSRSAAVSVLLAIAVVAGTATFGLRHTPVVDAVNAGSITELQVTGRAGVPNDASAAVINFTAVNPSQNGYLTAYPCGEPRPTAATLNYQAGTPATGNATVVKIGTGGKICIFSLQRADIVADINGWFPAGADYTPRSPNRLLDTRPVGGDGSGGRPDTANAVFVETFDGNGGLNNLDTHVFHRNVDIHDYDGFSGGNWTGDHDLNCGSPDTQRALRFNGKDSQTTRRANSFYTCRDHMMTAMGDVENYSIVAFGPAEVFSNVSSVNVDVNLTDLGNRQWWKIGVLSTRDCPALDKRCMYSDVAAADLSTDLATSGRLIASWSGGLSAGYPGGLKIGNTQTSASFSAGNDKATRHPVSLIDNGNGTVTFKVANRSATVNGSFPACPCRVVFYDHNYTPDKSPPETGKPVIGYTWHWDNIVVKG